MRQLDQIYFCEYDGCDEWELHRQIDPAGDALQWTTTDGIKLEARRLEPGAHQQIVEQATQIGFFELEANHFTALGHVVFELSICNDERGFHQVSETGYLKVLKPVVDLIEHFWNRAKLIAVEPPAKSWWRSALRFPSNIPESWDPRSAVDRIGSATENEQARDIARALVSSVRDRYREQIEQQNINEYDLGELLMPAIIEALEAYKARVAFDLYGAQALFFEVADEIIFRNRLAGNS